VAVKVGDMFSIEVVVRLVDRIRLVLENEWIAVFIMV